MEGEPKFEKEPVPENKSELQPTTFKPYKVMLLDYFERGWMSLEAWGEYEFDDEESAMKKRDEENLEEFGTLNPRYDHYGVFLMFDVDRGREINCPATFV